MGFLVRGETDNVDLANSWSAQDVIVRGDLVDNHELLYADHW